MPQYVSAVKGRPYAVYAINDQQVAVSRNGYTIPFTKQDLAAVFTALFNLLESNTQ